MRIRLYLFGFVSPLLLIGCSSTLQPTVSTTDATRQPDEYGYVTVDMVKKVEDPKAGFWGHKLQSVYPEGEDKPLVFCDSGPSIPLHKLVTIFDDRIPSKPDSSACKKIIAVVEGQGVWYGGRPMQLSEAEKIKTNEERFVEETMGTISGQTSFALRNPKPIGDPCSTIGSVQEVKSHSRGHRCSLVMVYTTGIVVFLNWKVSGIDRSGVDAEGPAPTGSEVVAFIRKKYGDKYIVSK